MSAVYSACMSHAYEWIVYFPTKFLVHLKNCGKAENEDGRAFKKEYPKNSNKINKFKKKNLSFGYRMQKVPSKKSVFLEF